MKFLLYISVTATFTLWFSNEAAGQQFVYRPINPAFGGNPMNYQWLLSSAQAQNDFKEPSVARDYFFRDPMDDFQANLSRQLLSQLSRQLMINRFGEDKLTEGSYVIGNYEIEVTSGLQGLVVEILDIITGGKTTITIPHY
jgi:curli production assembly/transport component CsgF